MLTHWTVILGCHSGQSFWIVIVRGAEQDHRTYAELAKTLTPTLLLSWERGLPTPLLQLASRGWGEMKATTIDTIDTIKN
ncbi:MAG: hypothetical protein EA001_15325 [Oscillatoriales cyanobacterium]|nr:MAG: hypothetical protein EA001_15325 [Oscillatoriales cyanobacterium]